MIFLLRRLKHKFSGRSKSRIRRLSEHIRKETISTAGQGDTVTKNNFDFTTDNARKDKERSIEGFRQPRTKQNGNYCN